IHVPVIVDLQQWQRTLSPSFAHLGYLTEDCVTQFLNYLLERDEPIVAQGDEEDATESREQSRGQRNRQQAHVLFVRARGLRSLVQNVQGPLVDVPANIDVLQEIHYTVIMELDATDVHFHPFGVGDANAGCDDLAHGLLDGGLDAVHLQFEDLLRRRDLFPALVAKQFDEFLGLLDLYVQLDDF